MPVIPQYQSRLSPNAADPVPAIPTPQRTNPIGQGLEQVGQVVGSIGTEMVDKLKQKELADATMGAGKLVSETALQYDKYLQDANTSGESQDGLYKRAADDFDATTAQTLNQIQNPHARRLAEAQLQQLRTNVLVRAMHQEAEAAVAGRAATLDQTGENYKILVSTDPTQYEHARTAIMTAIANGGFDPQTRTRLAMQYTAKLGDAALQGYIQRDPAAVKGMITSGYGVRTPDVEAAASATATRPGIVDVDMLLPGVLKQESGGKQSAVSPKGAVGVAQILPSTGPEAAALAGVPWDPARFKSDTAYNTALGRAYLNAQLTAFDGDSAKALAAYNAGPGRVQAAVEKYGDDWLAHMPKETREYVAKINPAPPSGGAQSTQTAAVVPAPNDPDLRRALEDVGANALPGYLSAAQQQLNKHDAQARSDVASRENSDVAAYMNGIAPANPLQAADYVRAYGQTEGMQRYQQYAETRQLGTDIQLVQSMPDAQAEALLKSYAPGPNTPNVDLAVKRQAMLAQAVDAVRSARQADPISYAQQSGVGNAQPLDFNDAAKFAQNLATRPGLARTMGELYRTPYQILSKPEAARLTVGFQSMSAQDKAGMLATIRSALPDDQAYLSVMQQLAPDSPVTAMAGAIMLAQHPAPHTTGALWWKKDAPYTQQDVASLLLEGETLLNPSKADKKADGVGRAIVMPKDADMRAQFTDAVGQAFAGSPQAASDSYDAVRAYYAAKSARTGDLSGELNSARMKESIEAVTGGTSQIGAADVIRPWGMSDATFRDEAAKAYAKAMTVAGFAGTPADVMDRYTFELGDKPGTYLLRSGTGYLTDAAHNPVVVDLAQSVRAAPPTVAPGGPEIVPKGAKTPKPRTATPNTQ